MFRNVSRRPTPLPLRTSACRRHPVRCSTEREIRDFLDGKTDGERPAACAVRPRARRAGPGAAERLTEALTVLRAHITRQPGRGRSISTASALASAAACYTRKTTVFPFLLLRQFSLRHRRVAPTRLCPGGNDRNGQHRLRAQSARAASSHQPAVHHRRILGRHADRVVRFLSLRRAGPVLQQALLLPGARSGARLHPEPVRVLDRVSGAAVRRDRVRPSRRPDRPQIHLHADPAADGCGDLCRRPVAGLRDDRHFGPDPARRDARAAGSGARRRIWRRGDLHRRACARRQTRVLHVLDSDHRDDGHRLCAARDPVVPPRLWRADLRRLGLAGAVPDLGGSCHPVDLYPNEARGSRRSSPD